MFCDAKNFIELPQCTQTFYTTGHIVSVKCREPSKDMGIATLLCKDVGRRLRGSQSKMAKKREIRAQTAALVSLLYFEQTFSVNIGQQTHG